MNKRSLLIFGASAVLLSSVVISGCNKIKDFGDTNVNPAATTTPILGALLTNVEAGLGSYASNTGGGLYCQYISETQYPDYSCYSLQQVSFTGHYSGPLYDLQNIIIQNQSNNMNAVALILQQYIFWRVTDSWGDVPYSGALKGDPHPAYDKQEDIYKGLLSNLTAAAGMFDNTSIITGDIIFGGNTALWKKTANSLRMMIALQLSKKYPGASDYAATQFKAALNDPGGYISSNSDNFDIVFPGGNFKCNWWNVYNGRNDYGESKTMTDLLSDLGDARINVYGGATQLEGQPNSLDPSSIGVPYGVKRATAEAFTSANPTWARVLRGDFRQQNGTTVILSAGQIALARAEAADLGWTSENLVSVYQQGITLSFAQWGLPAPSASYLAQADVVITPGGPNNKANISVQRWLAHYPDGMTGWDIWRKSGFPVLIPAPDATNASKQIPRRLAYATSEANTNTDAYNEAVGRMSGGDTQDSKVWWDQ